MAPTKAMTTDRPLDANDGEHDDIRDGLSLLWGSDLFGDFSPEELERFHDSIHMRTCEAHHVFYRPGESGEVMFLMKRGTAQIYRTSRDGRKLVIAPVTGGSIFGEMACIGQRMHDCYAEALEDSLICTMSLPMCSARGVPTVCDTAAGGGRDACAAGGAAARRHGLQGRDPSARRPSAAHRTRRSRRRIHAPGSR